MLEKKWMTTAEAAEAIGCTQGRVRAMCGADMLKAQKISPRVWLIDRRSVEAMAQRPYTTGRPRKKNPKKLD
jgi:hypothetical protein